MTKRATVPDNPTQALAPSLAEAQAIEQARTALAKKSPRIVVDLKQSDKGALEVLGPAHNDHAGWLARIENAFGTCGSAFALSQLNRLIAICRDASGEIDVARLNGLLALVEGARAQNEVQGALAVQMALTHHVAQTVLLRAARADQIPQFDSASNSAVKLLRTFALQAEVLAKLQRGGEQIVKVVHVHPGGQAIVGNVVSGQHDHRGGVDNEKRSQPHAKGRLPAGQSPLLPEVFSEDQKRHAMPVAIGQR